MASSAAASSRATKKKESQLTAEQKNEIKEAFDLFDADGYATVAARARRRGATPAPICLG